MNERRPEEIERDGEPVGDERLLDSEGVGDERGEKAVRILRMELDGLTGVYMLTILAEVVMFLSLMMMMMMMSRDK